MTAETWDRLRCEAERRRRDVLDAALRPRSTGSRGAAEPVVPPPRGVLREVRARRENTAADGARGITAPVTAAGREPDAGIRRGVLG